MKILNSLDSVKLVGVCTSPTPSSGDNSTKIATTEYVQREMASAGTGDMMKSVYDPNNDGIIHDILLSDSLVGTMAYPTITNGIVSRIDHKSGTTTIRSDVFTYATNLITEVRTIVATGKVVTFKYYLDTLIVEVI